MDQRTMIIRDSATQADERMLIAEIIGGRNADERVDRLFSRYADIQEMSRAPAEEIAKVAGLRLNTAVRLRAALELVRRKPASRPARPVAKRPQEIADLAAFIAHDEQENLLVVMMNARNEVIGVNHLYKGTAVSCNIRAADLFREPIRRNATAVVIVHNHPSGGTQPSHEDINVTKEIVRCGKMLDITVLDHVIVSADGFLSMKEAEII